MQRVKTAPFLLDCGVTEWSVWSPFSQYSGDGNRRSRQFDTNKVNCSEIIYEETELCRMPPCENTGEGQLFRAAQFITILCPPINSHRSASQQAWDSMGLSLPPCALPPTHQSPRHVQYTTHPLPAHVHPVFQTTSTVPATIHSQISGQYPGLNMTAGIYTTYPISPNKARPYQYFAG